MTTREQHLAKIRAAAIAANPEKTWQTHDHPGLGIDGIEVPCRLADVLLAIGKTTSAAFSWYCTDMGVIAQIGGNSATSWELGADDITLQSDECLAFIAPLV